MGAAFALRLFEPISQDMTPRSVLEISLSSHGQESFGEVMQEIVAGAAPCPVALGNGPAVPGAAKTPFFGRYRPERELGRGGMGVVWLVQDTVLDIPVALKLVPEIIVHDTEGIVNLKKEVLRGMALAHPGIVRVHGFEQQDKIAGIVMEHVDGESLAEKKVRQPDFCFDVEEVRPWLEQLCAALDYAHHEARIAHRDLKPGNLLLTSAGRIKIVDFGLASSLSETRSRISVRLGVSGTPPYMSPQQLMGQQPTHLDDLYSLGATLYELLTGTPPFFRGDIVAQVLHEPPAPLATRRAELGIKNHSPIPPAWERAIAACLSKDPAARPPTGAAILKILHGAGNSAASHDPFRGGQEHPHHGSSRTHPAKSSHDSADSNGGAAEISGTPAEMDATPALRLAPVPFAQPDLQIAPPPAPPETVQRVYPRPVPQRAPQKIPLRPLLAAGAFLVRSVAVAIRGLADLLISVLRPLLKVAAVIAVLWGLLHLKQKWDAGAAERQAAALRQAQPADAPAPPVPATQVVFLPPPPPPPPPGPGPDFGPQAGRPPGPDFGPQGGRPPAPPAPPSHPPRR